MGRVLARCRRVLEDGETVVVLGHTDVKKGDQRAKLPVVHIWRFRGDDQVRAADRHRHARRRTSWAKPNAARRMRIVRSQRRSEQRAIAPHSLASTAVPSAAGDEARRQQESRSWRAWSGRRVGRRADPAGRTSARAPRGERLIGACECVAERRWRRGAPSRPSRARLPAAGRDATRCPRVLRADVLLAFDDGRHSLAPCVFPPLGKRRRAEEERPGETGPAVDPVAVSALPRCVGRSVGSTPRFGRDCWPQGQPHSTCYSETCATGEPRAQDAPFARASDAACLVGR